jgi:flavorubredoxin
VGINDRETDLFEAMWPLTQGISYNSFLLVDRKTALVDTVKKTHLLEFVEKVKAALPPGRGVDCLVINHIEPDHSGAIPVLKELFPGMQIVGNRKTVEFLRDFYRIDSDTVTVADGDRLDLGDRSMSFHITPMVHWPETMMTYDEKEKILFSGDAFGGFKALDGGLFDDEVLLDRFDDELLRYFSNIIGKFSPMVQKAIAKVKGLDIRMIASTHGPVWRTAPGCIIDKYDLWSRFVAEEGVVIAYASMYGNTLRMAEAVARGLARSGVREIRMHDVSRVNPSFIIRDLWRFKGVVLGSCTYETALFPPMRGLVELLEEKALKNRVLGIFGTYAWSGGAVKNLRLFQEKAGWKLVEPVVEAKCSADEDHLGLCLQLGENMAHAVSTEP